MMRRFDTLFARLFAVFLAVIVLAHLLVFVWLERYGQRPDRPPPRPPYGLEMPGPPPHPGPPPGDEPPWLPPWLGPPFLAQLIALLLAAWLGARLLARPVTRLGDAARQLSEDLDAPPLAETGPREARQAAVAFNRMHARIREQVQQRGRMLVAVSHDLRTPLARLRLRVEEIDNPALRERFGQDLGEMIALLESTLHYLHQAQDRETPQWLDVQALVEALAEDAQERGEAVAVSGQCAPLQAQPMALRSCLGNLVDNALRYAGQAQIHLDDNPVALTLRVVDQGAGIPAHLHEQVFEPYFRLEQSRNRDSGGIGLGLAIAREAARRQGGELTLEETPGGGLTACLVLPRPAL